MALKLFNTLSRSVQEFAPLDPAGKKVGMYCCGPTVYDFAHIGNWRTFVFADLVRRTLEFSGYSVQHVMNITDIEDKIIKRVRENKTTLREFTGKYEAAFLEDLEKLNCKKPTVMPRATEHILEITKLIEKLIARGIAYKASDGSVYFSITKYQGCGCNYGQLLKLNFDEMRAGERVKSDEYAKESVADFALWKSRAPDDGDVFWSSPFGEGRPGWHIECSAMSMKILGASFDLHLGGEDLIFPHHERFSGRAFALRDFVFVMRENQILATEMQIKTRAENFHSHRAAFDVPAGTAFAKRTRPENLAVVRRARFPERKIGDGFFRVFVAFDALAGAHFIEVELEQLAVIAAAAAIFFD